MENKRNSKKRIEAGQDQSKTNRPTHKPEQSNEPIVNYPNVCTTEISDLNVNNVCPKFVPCFSVDYSINGRAKCQACKKVIIKNHLRIGKTKMFKSKEILQFHHIPCAFEMFRSCRTLSNIIKAENEVKGFDVIAEVDKQRIRDEIIKIQPIIDVIKTGVSSKKSRNESTGPVVVKKRE